MFNALLRKRSIQFWTNRPSSRSIHCIADFCIVPVGLESAPGSASVGKTVAKAEKK